MVVKGKKIYVLEICYDDSTDELEYVKEFIEGSTKSFYYGEVDLADFFDDEGLTFMENVYEVGVS